MQDNEKILINILTNYDKLSAIEFFNEFSKIFTNEMCGADYLFDVLNSMIEDIDEHVQYFDGEVPEYNLDYDKLINTIDKDFKMVWSEGGYEGGGDSFSEVWYFKSKDLYIRIDGYFDSYNGRELNDAKPYIVRPKQVMVTVYEKE